MDPFWELFWDPKLLQNETKNRSTFGCSMDPFLGSPGAGVFLGEPQLHPEGPRTPYSFIYRLGPRTPPFWGAGVQGAGPLPGFGAEPRNADLYAPRSPEASKKGIQKWTPKLIVFGPILDPFWELFWDPKLLQNETKDRTTFGCSMDPFLGSPGPGVFLGEPQLRPEGPRTPCSFIYRCIYVYKCFGLKLLDPMHY